MAARKGQSKGNGFGLRHGAVALRDLIRKNSDPSHPVMILVNDKAKQYIADRGGLESLSSLEVDSLRHAATLDLLTALTVNRLINPSGRIKRMKAERFRDLVIVYCRITDSFNRVASAVGLQRRPKDLPSLQQFLHDAASDGQDPHE